MVSINIKIICNRFVSHAYLCAKNTTIQYKFSRVRRYKKYEIILSFLSMNFNSTCFEPSILL
jgi:hypothetical protein